MKFIKILSLALMFTLNFLYSQSSKLYNIGDKVDWENNTTKEFLTLISPSQLSPTKKYSFDGVIYYISIDDSFKVVGITTADSNFITNENIKVGDFFKDVKMKTNYSVSKISGYCYQIKLKSGWSACFSDYNFGTSKALNDTTRVRWFVKNIYQRK